MSTAVSAVHPLTSYDIVSVSQPRHCLVPLYGTSKFIDYISILVYGPFAGTSSTTTQKYEGLNSDEACARSGGSGLEKSVPVE